MPSLGDWLDVGQKPVEADFAFGLGGSPLTRPFTVAALVKGGWATQAIVIMPEESLDKQTHLPRSPWADREALLARGVPKHRIVELPGRPLHTRDEAETLMRFLRDRPDASVLVVTCAPHSRRARWVFVSVLGNQADQIRFVSAPNDLYTLDRWWRSEQGFQAVAMEYPKLWFYWVRYGQLGVWLLAFGLAATALIVWAAWRHRRAWASWRQQQAIGD